jgi:uncharacterized membrane protein YcaP (DUF421 family)
MDASPRRRAVVFVIPIILSLVVGRRVAENVRTVDYLQILTIGVIIGVSLAGMLRTFGTKRGAKG